ncbi:MAG: 2-succinyl-5-enolpyruvyl-6-hydroxy-3-cyclohexene-1-carboxylic-acid synthase [Symploca sp. SIO2D2]|nr:2-succinyl-5-enolpyruvyl-6-hydroxy-3-cyclohexene-1-carboxylic-acid synthase [Symploca sp. SIO2D2]
MDTDFPNLNALWSHVLVQTLADRGMEYAVICPGSRSSPLAFAFSKCETIEAISVLDERSAAFFAMGLAKRSGKPAALVCTSGTAAANFFPAIIEASESSIPMLVLTADRPPEMRQNSAGQTIDQVKLYGGYVKEQIDVAVPEASVQLLRYLRETASYFFSQSVAHPRGPVHLNMPFRDPLPPIRDSHFLEVCEKANLSAILESSRTGIEVPAVRSIDLSDFVDTDKGVLIVGPHSPMDADSWVAGVCDLAQRLGWPVLCDGLNPLRSSGASLDLVTHYDTIVRSEDFIARYRPEKAIVLQELPTSKVLRSLIAQSDMELMFLSALGRDLNAPSARARCVQCDLSLDRALLSEQPKGEFHSAWAKAQDLMQSFFASKLDGANSLFEGRVASVLSEKLQEGASVLFSNGMPPRDCEFFWRSGSGKQKIYFNRGVNGIDGVLSTALGVAHRGAPTVLVIGDLALLHDTNGALLNQIFEGSLTILLINNAGGGIFEMLPVAEFGSTFEQYFACEQHLEFSDWAKTYRISYDLINDWEHLEKRVTSLPNKGIQLLELKTDRKSDAACRKAWFNEGAALLDERFG